jgi:poly(A) polymerase Pap1
MDALKDDIIGGPSLDLNFCSEDKAYCFVDVLKLKKYTNSIDFINAKVKDPREKQDLKTISESLKETDNPILVVVTLKK